MWRPQEEAKSIISYDVSNKLYFQEHYIIRLTHGGFLSHGATLILQLMKPCVLKAMVT